MALGDEHSATFTHGQEPYRLGGLQQTNPYARRVQQQDGKGHLALVSKSHLHVAVLELATGWEDCRGGAALDGLARAHGDSLHWWCGVGS